MFALLPFNVPYRVPKRDSKLLKELGLGVCASFHIKKQEHIPTSKIIEG